MYNDIEGFNWNHTDKFRNEWSWPEDDPGSTASQLIYSDHWDLRFMGNVFTKRLKEVLANCQPYPGDDRPNLINTYPLSSHFIIFCHEGDLLTICDNKRNFNLYLHMSQICLDCFSIGKWYAKRCMHQLQDPYQWKMAHQWLMFNLKRDHCIGEALEKRATQLLEIGAPYSKESDLDKMKKRFNISLNIVHKDIFYILDRACCISVDIT
jgi:hypothetical protein